MSAVGATTVIPSDTGNRSNAAIALNKGQLPKSFEVNDFPIPSSSDEAWRFTPLRKLRGLHDGTAAITGQAIVTAGTSSGVTVETVGRTDSRLGSAGIPMDRIAAQAFSSFNNATVVTVAANSELIEPFELTIMGPGSGLIAYGHTLIQLEAHSRATFVIDQRGAGTYAENIEFAVAEGAALTIVNIHDWDTDAVHVAQHHIKLAKNAGIKHFSVSLGGQLVRVNPIVQYAGPGGDAEMWGLYFADAGQHLEQRLLVDHSVPQCRSRVTYKGALQGVTNDRANEAHTVWVGDVLIRAAAEGTDTYELNRNLILTDGARADSIPNLEIETGEILGAGHASATGRFDDEQLFYLQARGISEEAARRLVVRGFFGEIISKITIPALRERLEAAIEAELAVAGV